MPLDRDKQASAQRGGAHRSGRAPGPGRQRAADTALGLQGLAGNAAVTGLLAGDGPAVLRQSLQRETAPAGAGSAAADARAGPRPAGGTVMSIPDLGKPVPLLSVSRGTPKRGGAGGGQSLSSMISVTVANGAIVTRLAAAAAAGARFPAVTITTAAVTYAMTGVVFTSLAITKDTTDLSLDYESLTEHYGGS
jgi:hypothetical protein